ncbi:hypothetical protein BGW80DRAFT_1307473 [Lactifluus volemus]|nr:hypothetical protein BGW80DRAFT_1307473 [Lactifluus volemus]
MISNHFIGLHQGTVTGDAPPAPFNKFKMMSYHSCDNRQHQPTPEPEIAGTPPPPATHTSSHPPNVPPPGHISNSPASTVSPNNNITSVPSQHVDGASTAPPLRIIIASDSPSSTTMPGGPGPLMNESDHPRTSSPLPLAANIQVDPQIHPYDL